MRRGSVACRREPTEEEIKGKQMSSEREREIEKKRERKREREGERGEKVTGEEQTNV